MNSDDYSSNEGQENWLADVVGLGRGRGDPDVYGYPGEDDPNYIPVNKPSKEQTMSGSRSGGIKAAKKNKRKYGADFYEKIGRIGGQRGHIGGFNMPGVASRAGKRGGQISKRPPAK